MNRTFIAGLFVIVCACSTTRVTYQGELVVSDPILEPKLRRTARLRGVLTDASVQCGVDVVMDRSFETVGFSPSRPVFRTQPGERCVVRVSNDRTNLFVAVRDLQPGLHTEFVPHLWTVRRSDDVVSALVCKGGTGRITFDEHNASVSCKLACRVYANGTEVEATTVDVSGDFSFER